MKDTLSMYIMHNPAKRTICENWIPKKQTTSQMWDGPFLYALQNFFEGSLSFRCSFVNTCAFQHFCKHKSYFFLHNCMKILFCNFIVWQPFFCLIRMWAFCIGNTKTISVSIQVKLNPLHQWCRWILKINMCQTSNGTCHLIHQSTWFPKIYIFCKLPNHGDFNRRNFTIIKQIG